MAMSGADLIRAERYRQIHSEHYTEEHDSGHEGELIAAAACYVAVSGYVVDSHHVDETVVSTAETPALWPWAPVYWKPTGDPKRDLVKAGALIAAALDAMIAAQPVELVPSEGIKR